MTVFTEYVWTSGQTGGKNFQIKAATCGPGLINPQLVYLLKFDLKRSCHSLHLLQLNLVLVSQITDHKNLAALTGKRLTSLRSINGVGSHFVAVFLSVKSCRVLFLVCNHVTRWPCRLFAEFA